MDLFITERLRRLLPRLRDFVQSELLPLEHEFLNRPFRESLPVLRAKREQAKELGFWTPFLAEAHGGLGLTLTEFAHISEELGRTPGGHYVCNCQAPDVGNMEALLSHADAVQQERFLMPLVRGEIRSCFAMTEPDFPGSNPTLLGTTATADGADYVINGRKWFTSSADGAAFAIVMAVTDADAPKHARASQIIVPTDTPGFRILRNISIMGDAGSDYSSHAEVVFEDCRVPQSNRLGAVGHGFAIAQERLGPGRIHHCMRWIGICERAFDLLCRRAASRELAPGRLLGSRQIVQEWIADSRAEIDAARLLVLRAAHEIDTHGAPAARVSISLVKFFVANVLQKVLDRSIQAHGALGITDDTPLAYWYRHERAARIYDGPDEVHKTVVARAILRTYGVEI